MSKKNRKEFIPEWVLSDEWAVSRDPLNWKLYQKRGVGDNAKWKVIGYYNLPEQLLESILARVLLTEEQGNRELIAHLENCLAVATTVSKTFIAMLKIEMEKVDEIR